MTIDNENLKSGIDYVSNLARREHDFESIYVVDIGRERRSKEPIMIFNWETKNSNSSSYVHKVLEEEQLERSFTPDENTKVVYETGIDPVKGYSLGEYKELEFISIDEEQRENYRSIGDVYYTPDDEALERLEELLN